MLDCVGGKIASDWGGKDNDDCGKDMGKLTEDNGTENGGNDMDGNERCGNSGNGIVFSSG